jgi:hypothetical protein
MTLSINITSRDNKFGIFKFFRLSEQTFVDGCVADFVRRLPVFPINLKCHISGLYTGEKAVNKLLLPLPMQLRKDSFSIEITSLSENARQT